MQAEDRAGDAAHLLEHPLIKEILDKIESDAMEVVINERDLSKRDERIQFVRAIRSLRQELQSIANAATNPEQRNAVA